MIGLNDAYMRINHSGQEPQGYRLALGYSLGGPLRSHRSGFSFSGGGKGLDRLSRHPTALEKEALD